MAETPKAPARPWTPTERPGDASYTSPVVFHGDHRVGDAGDDSDSNSEVSWEDDTVPQSTLSPEGREEIGHDISKPQPLRFRSSYAFLRDDAAAPAPEAQGVKPQRSSHALNVDRSDQVPSSNPNQLHLNIEATGNNDALDLPTQYSAETHNAEHDDSRLPSNNPYRLSQATRSESTEGLLVKPQRRSQAPREGSSDDLLVKPQRLPQGFRTESLELVPTTKRPAPQTSQSESTILAPASRPRSSSQAPTIKADSDLPSITGTSARPISILLINPNSTKSITTRCLESIASTVPSHVTVYGFTAPRPAPTAIESQTDAIMSTAACTKAILPMANKYDAFLVACFSHHPLIAALREQLMQPVTGIMEASLYASRMCGGKLGIVTTGIRSSLLHDASVKNVYGMGAFSVGTESSRLGVLDLESRDREEVHGRIAMAARRLQARGADCICLGCAGMTDLQKTCQHAVGMHDRMAMVVDGVAMGVHFLVGLVRENLGTAKGGRYNTASGHKALKQAH